MTKTYKYGELTLAIRELLTAPGRNLTPHQIAEELGANIKTVLSVQWAMNHPKEYAVQRERAYLKAKAKYRKERRAELARQEKVLREKLLATTTNAGVQMDLFTPVLEELKENPPPAPAFEPAVLNPTMRIINSGTLPDMVNNPAHYTVGGISVFDFIEAKKLSYGRGNVVKYVTRAGVKDPATELQDLEKAQWYLTAEIERLKGSK